MNQALENARKFLDGHYEEMTSTLISWCSINSGSWNWDGNDLMLNNLIDSFSRLPGKIEVVPGSTFELISRSGTTKSYPARSVMRMIHNPEAPIQILFNGHMDTVYGKEDPFQNHRFLEDNILNAPGCSDMKGGLVVMLYSLLAFQETCSDQNLLGWEILITQDEEIGSHSSRYILELSAMNKHYGLIFEPALPDGSLARKRAGVGTFTFNIKGKSAHSGRDFSKGINSIVGASHLIESLHNLNFQIPTCILNIGSIEGGCILNIVPERTTIQCNVRAIDKTTQIKVEKEINRIVSDYNSASPCQISLHGSFNRPPKLVTPETEKLFNFIHEAGKQMDLAIDWKDTGGASDGNLLQHFGLPTIDNLGVRGGNIHNDQEFVLLDSLVERALLTTGTLLNIIKHRHD